MDYYLFYFCSLQNLGLQFWKNVKCQFGKKSDRIIVPPFLDYLTKAVPLQELQFFSNWPLKKGKYRESSQICEKKN
jgi:hypothetical protein